MRRHPTLLFVIPIVVVLAASSGPADEAGQVPAAGEAAERVPTFGPDYLIGPGDELGIEVWKDPALTRAVVVLPDGTISFPLIGELLAGGKTVAGLKSDIEERLARFTEKLVLTVEVRQSNSMHVYVLGQVNAPGRLILNSNINVLQALAIAGGPNSFASHSRIRILRSDGEKTVVIPFDYDDVTAGKKLETNILLRRGDVIFVP
ncbi:MAG: polysaccharide biosynthesis/export family protein [Verrucomicrobiota bacterium]